MRLRLRRESPDIDRADNSFDTEILTAEDFLEANQDTLLESKFVWAGISEAFGDFKADGVFSETVQGAIEIFIESEAKRQNMDMQGQQSLRQRLASPAHRLPSDVGPYLFSYLSYCAGQDKKGAFSLTRGLAKELPTLPDKLVAQILKYGLMSDSSSFARLISRLPDQFMQGNAIREDVVNSLSAAILQNPEIVTGILKVDKPECVNLKEELRKLCAVDWYSDNGSSQLRKTIEEVKNNEELHLEGFIESVESDTRDARLAEIREMGHFALAASGVDISSNPSIREPLLASKAQWDRFDIDKAFYDYRNTEYQKLQAILLKFVGGEYEARKNIRFPRSEADHSALKMRFAGYFDGDRQQRRRVKASAKSASRQLTPNLQDIVNESQAARATEEAKSPTINTLSVVKRSSTGHLLEPTTAEELLKDFTEQPELKNDINRMIEQIIADPKGQGTISVKSGRIWVKINSKKLSLRQFSPMRKTGFSVSNEAKGYRVVYSVVGDELIIVDIIRRDQFEEKYA